MADDADVDPDAILEDAGIESLADLAAGANPDGDDREQGQARAVARRFAGDLSTVFEGEGEGDGDGDDNETAALVESAVDDVDGEALDRLFAAVEAGAVDDGTTATADEPTGEEVDALLAAVDSERDDLETEE